jgi:acyl-CoA synthetase (AMP-forming)/AMP-acid ligase II
MNIANWLEATAAAAPGRPALFHGTEMVADYSAFAGSAAAMATHLADRLGVQPGHSVAVYMANCTAYLECLYGIWWAGAVAVPVNAKLHPREAAWIFADSGVRLAFVDDAAKAALAIEGIDVPCVLAGERYEAPAQTTGKPCSRAPHELAWLFYTSGTTGRPKGAMLSHGNLVAMSLSYLADVDEVSAEDAALYAAPLSHGAGLYNFIHVRRGARHVVPISGGFDAAEVLSLSRQLGRVSFFAAPTMVHRLVDAAKATGQNGEGIRTIVYGGGPMYRADIEAALALLGPKFVQIYGQGESPMTITALSRADHSNTEGRRLASVGRAHSAVEVRVVDAERMPLPPGEPGEIEVRGLTVMRGYWNNPEATARTLRDGWLLTGDIGVLDEDGYLTLSDRSKDVIISGGSNIYPREVEEVLLTHPAVREASVVGEPDSDWGETVVAFVVAPDAPPDLEAVLDRVCLGSIARFKRPKRYLLVPELPKNNYGKVLKTELRRRLQGDAIASSGRR